MIGSTETHRHLMEGGERPVRSQARMTVFEARGRQRLLTKVLSLGENGKIIKDASQCALTLGDATEIEIADLQDLNDRLDRLTPKQAVSYGVAGLESRTTVVSRKKAHQFPDAITRTADRFSYPQIAVMMLDYDPPSVTDDVLLPEQLRNLLIGAVPELADVQMLWRPSASSCIYHRQTGEQLIGIAGQRIYFIVAGGSQIPTIGKILETRLWLAGHGRVEFSVSGSVLLRCPVDTSVWQPERLDFAAGASCQEPLERRPVPGKILNPDGQPFIDARIIKSLDTSEEMDIRSLKNNARKQARSESRKKTERYIDAQVRRELGDKPPKEKAAAVREKYRLATNGLTLTSEYVLHLDNGETVTVGEVLANKDRYHGMTLADPLEPDYGGGRCKAKLFLAGTRPVVHSFAHGGRTFRLKGQKRTIRLADGLMMEIRDAICDALNAEPDIFWMEQGIVAVEAESTAGGRIIRLNQETLTMRVSSIIRFVRSKKVGNDYKEVDVDPPGRLMQQIANAKTNPGLRRLAGVVTAPTLRPDGSVLRDPGYDEPTRLLLLLNEPAPEISDHPTEGDRGGKANHRGTDRVFRLGNRSR